MSAKTKAPGQLAYSIKQAAAATGVSATSITRAIHRTDSQALPAKLFGNRYLIQRSALEQWISRLPDA